MSDGIRPPFGPAPGDEVPDVETLQRLGLRISEWDLWGDDIDEAFACLRDIAAG